jgi:protein O-GlcNAc transferase
VHEATAGGSTHIPVPQSEADLTRDILRLPGEARLYGRLGNRLRRSGNSSCAVTAFRRGSCLAPTMERMNAAHAAALADLGRHTEARAALLAAIRRGPDGLQLCETLVSVAERSGSTALRRDALRRCALAQPNHARAYAGLAISAAEEASGERLGQLRRAWRLDPLLAGAAANLGATFRGMGRQSAALPWLIRALVVAPELAPASSMLGNVLHDRGEAALALRWYKRAVVARPSLTDLTSNLLMASQYVEGVDAGALLEVHRRWGALVGVAPRSEAPRREAPRRAAGRPIRVGLASPNLNGHPVGRLVAGLVEHHDRREIEIFCYSDTAPVDGMTGRLRAAAEGWRETRGLSDQAWIDAVRADGLDVLVELAGHTAGNRIRPMAARVAPIQGSWAGYVGTTGLDFIDFLVADRFHVPDGEDTAYAERVLRLPDGYATYTPPDTAPEPGPPPAGIGGGVTFGSFSNPAKLNPGLARLWARVLGAVPGSRLLLKYRGLDDSWCSASFRRWLAEAGVPADRVSLEGGSPPAAMLEAYRRVDIALDTQPYSGGVTVCESLYMGVPVIAMAGRSFAGRHAVSHLHNTGLPDLVAADAADYVAKAAALARDLDRLAALRATLRATMLAAPICDHGRFACAFAGALRMLLEDGRSAAGPA